MVNEIKPAKSEAEMVDTAVQVFPEVFVTTAELTRGFVELKLTDGAIISSFTSNKRVTISPVVARELFELFDDIATELIAGGVISPIVKFHVEELSIP